MKRFPLKTASILASIIFAPLAFAAEGGSIIPNAALPDQVSKSLTQEQSATPAAEVLPPIVNPTKQSSTDALASQAKKVKFKLNGIILQGNTTYSTTQLSAIYQKDLNRTITVEELFNIVQGITNYYRNNGYILSRAILPPQQVKNGLVKIQVIEGYLANVDVAGNPYGAKKMVQRFGDKIVLSRPLQINRMEKYLLLANEIPGAQVRAVLAPSKTKTGAADLTLMTELRRVTGYMSYDNYGTRYIGPQQITGNIGVNSFITSGDATNLTVIKTPKGGELTFTDLNYNAPLDAEGKRVLIGGTQVHTHPLYILRETQIDGMNNNYYANFSFPMIRSRSESLTARLNFNFLDSYVTILDTPLYADHVRSIDLGATYNFADRWLGSNLLSADLRQGLPIFGWTSTTDVNTSATSRPGGRAKYTKIIATASRLQSIRGAFSAFGIVTGQWAFNPVLASEQFSFGGSQLGRGFDAGEIVGDKGLAGSLELRYDLGIARFMLQSMQLYTFFDAGRVWNFRKLGANPFVESATSTGVGTRFYFAKNFSGNLMWTKPLTNKVAAEEILSQGYRPRVFFSLIATL